MTKCPKHQNTNYGLIGETSTKFYRRYFAIAFKNAMNKGMNSTGYKYQYTTEGRDYFRNQGTKELVSYPVADAYSELNSVSRERLSPAAMRPFSNHTIC